MAKHSHVLTIKGDTFNALATDFDSILRDTLSTMENKGSDNGKMTVTVDISLDLDTAPDYNAKHDATRQVIKPTFKHKVSSVIQLKDERTGKLGGDYELVWNPDLQKYELRPLAESHGQGTLFQDQQQEQSAEGAMQLEGREVLQLTAGDSDDTVDSDYVDVEYTAVDEGEELEGQDGELPQASGE